MKCPMILFTVEPRQGAVYTDANTVTTIHSTLNFPVTTYPGLIPLFAPSGKGRTA
jgi:hypothetical protein